MTEATEQRPVTALRGVGAALAERLEKLGIRQVQDLLFMLPTRYEDRTRIVPLGGLTPGEHAVVEGEVQLTEVTYRRRRQLLCRISDGSGFLTLRFFHFTTAQQSALTRGLRLRCYGEVRRGPVGLEIVHPEYRRVGAEPDALEALPADLPAAVAVVQHVPSGFNEALVRFLRGSTSLRVEVAPDTAVPCTPGTVFVAPDDRHLVCPREGYIVALHESALGGYLPSATMLFKSMSAAYRDACAGVILSGAGDDGAEGATILRSRGGLTIAEDNHASPADMPRAAVDAGGIDRVLPLALIADTLLSAIDGMLDRRPTP